MSRFLKPADKPAATTRRRSVYDDRPARKPPEWVQVADTNPHTGQLEWEHDWVSRVTGWRPLDDVLRERGGLW